MAYPAPPTYFAVNDSEARLGWERDLAYDVISPSYLMNPKSGLVGNSEAEDPNESMAGFPVIERRNEQFKQGGSRSRVTLVRGFRREPTMGNQTLREREEGLETQTFDWDINLLRHAGKTDGEIVDQRITWKAAEQIRRNHRIYWPQIVEAAACMHACGFNVNSTSDIEWWLKGAKTNMTLCNAVSAPDANHIMRAGGLSTDTDVGANPTAILDVQDIDEMVARADTLPIPIKPITVNGQQFRGLLLMHTYQEQTLRKKNSTWFATMQNAIRGGGSYAKNPLFSGKFQGILGVWNDVIMAKSRYITPGVAAGAAVDNTRRAVFLGGQALTLGLGKNYKNENTFKIASDNWDYGDKVGIAIRCLLGMAKTRFLVAETGNTEDFASIVFTSYAKQIVSG